MNHLKMLGLAAVTTAALMAFLGAGTASATVLCKNNLNTEKCSEPWPVGTEGTASLTESANLTDTSGNSFATCTASTVTGTLKSQGSEKPALSELSTLTWGPPGAGCNTTVDTIKPGSGELTWIKGTDNGTLWTRETEVTLIAFGVSCTYGAGSGTLMGTTVGGNPGSLNVNAVINKTAGGFLCPFTAKFTGRYVATSPKNAWVAAG